MISYSGERSNKNMNCDFTSSAAGNLMKHLKTPNLTLIFITLGSKQMKNWKVRDNWTGKIGSTLRILILKIQTKKQNQSF